MAISPQENGAGDQAAGRSGPVLINDQYLVDVNTPIIELDTPSAKAFAVRDRRDQDKQLFALACTPGLPTRMDLLRKLFQEGIDGLLPIAAWEVVYWPPINQHTVIVIYQRPLGGSVLSAIEKGEFRINEYEIQGTFIEPVFSAIKEMDALALSHREIRVENLFFLDKERTKVVLGDCVTCPPGFDQPILYETIERGMASPAGRGSGSISDDLYALGVTIAALFLRDKMPNYKTMEALLTAKIEQGTYSALCGKQKIPNTFLEPLRGILRDETGERWAGLEMEMWISGKRQTPLQRKATPKSDKPFLFMDEDYYNPRSLAHAFTLNVKEGAEAIKTPEFENWLRRKLGDGDLADEVNAVVAAALHNEGSIRGSNDFLVTKTSIMMDPVGPIRYKGLSFIPSGFGRLLAVELLRRNSMQVGAEIIAQNISGLWYSQTTELARDETSLEFQSVFGKMKSLLQINSPGFGIERCLYELNNSLPCLSPLIVEQSVIYIDDLLPALDNIADTTNKKQRPLDRHVTAFIAARFRERIAPHLKALAEPRDSTFVIGMLSLMAYLQWKLNVEPVYALTSWVGSQLAPAVKTYNSRSTRRKIEQDMPRVIRQGSLPELFDLIDNAEKRRLDTEQYAQARFEYATAEGQIQEIEDGELSTPESAVEMGQKFAAMTSVIITMIVISILILAEFW